MLSHASEVTNVLTVELNLEDAVKVWKEEGIEEGIEKVARSMLAEGFAPETIMKCTGLDERVLLSLR